MLAAQKNGLHGDNRAWNHHRQFMWDTARISQIGNDETGHAGERLDRSGQVFSIGFIEVEQNGQEVTFAQLLAYSIEHCLTLIRETTQDQNRLGGNGVDHVTNFLVMKQEVDELRDLNV